MGRKPSNSKWHVFWYRVPPLRSADSLPMDIATCSLAVYKWVDGSLYYYGAGGKSGSGDQYTTLESLINVFKRFEYQYALLAKEEVLRVCRANQSGLRALPAIEAEHG